MWTLGQLHAQDQEGARNLIETFSGIAATGYGPQIPALPLKDGSTSGCGPGSGLRGMGQGFSTSRLDAAVDHVPRCGIPTC